MKKFALLIVILALIAGCKSTDGSATKDNSSLAVSGSKLQPIDEARAAILRAESVNARQYAVDEMELADELVANALKQDKERDKKEQAKLATEKANEAYQRALPYYKTEMKADLKAILLALQADQVDLFAYDSYRVIEQQINDAEATLAGQEMIAFQRQHDRIIQNSQKLSKAVSNNRNRVLLLRQQANREIEDSRLSNDQLDQLLLSGEEKELDYDLAGAFSDYQQALALLNQLKMANEENKNLIELEQEMRRVQREIEGASRLFVIGEKGERIYPNKWNGNDYLQRNPMPLLNNEPSKSNEFVMDELESYTIALVTAGGQTWVAADINNTGLYQKAIDLWQEGVDARNQGDLDAASNYFEKSMEHIIEFKRGAVAKIYVVKYNPTLRDCLWRIASFKDIYDNKYLWPLLWQRNQTQIVNPDLIYPGQELLVPPLID